MADKIYLSKNMEMSLNQEDNPINLNQIVCGSTGSGKTMSYVDPILSHVEDTNLIITCTKSRLVKQYSASLRKRGYRVHHLNLADPKGSTCKYDPLHYLKTDEDLIAFSRAIVETGQGLIEKDPYWDAQAMMLLQALLGYAIGPETHHTLRDFKELLDLANLDQDSYSSYKRTVDILFDEYERKYPHNSVSRIWKKVSGLTDKPYSTVISIANQCVEALFPQSIEELADNKRLATLDLECFAKEKSVLFITTSPVNPALHKLANLIYDQIFRSLFELGERMPDGKLPRHIHIIADDFATGSRIPDFSQKISIFREKRISMSMLIQDQSQLTGMYGHSAANTITNNADSYVFYGGLDVETCQMISKKTNRPFSEIMEMPLEHLWLIQRGSKAMMMKRYPIFEDKAFQKIQKDFHTKAEEKAKKKRTTVHTQKEERK